MATVTLYPVSLATAGGWTDESGGSPAYTLIDEVTGSPGTDYIRGTIDAATTAGQWGLTTITDAAFAVPSAATLDIRHSRGSVEGGDNGGGNDTYTLFARIYAADGTTALTDELTVETGTVGYLVKSETALAFAGIPSNSAGSRSARSATARSSPFSVPPVSSGALCAISTNRIF